MTQGVVLGLISAAVFGLGAVCMRVGMRDRADDGLYTTVLVNTLFLGIAMLVVSLPRWNRAGLLAFCLSGVLATSLGRAFSFRAVRLIGASRANAFSITAPVFSAIGGWIVLDERLQPIQVLGGIVVIAGLALLVRSSGSAESLASQPTTVTAVLPGESPERVLMRQLLVRRFREGRDAYVYAAIAAMFFGLAFVARKYGIERYPSAVAGGFFGASTALVVLSATAFVRGRLLELILRNVATPSRWFLAGGAAMSFGLIFQFSTYRYLQAWLVSLLLGTQGLWTLLWSYLFIRHEERIRRELIASVLLVVAGVAIITVPGA